MKTPLADSPALFVFLSCVTALFLWDLDILPGVIPLVSVLVSAGSMMLLSCKTEPSWFRVFFLILFLSFVLPVELLHNIGKDNITEGFAVLKAKVIDERPWGSRRVTVIEDGGTRYLLRMDPGQVFRPGDILEIKGPVMPLESPRKGSDFNEKRYWMARGVDAQVVPYEISRNRGDARFGISSWRSILRTSIDTGLSDPLRSYILASWLGVKDPVLRERHSRWGTSHLLAVSGFHVGLVAGIAFLLFNRLRNRAVLISLVIWLYVLLTGFHASAFRAGIMLQMVLLGEIFRRPVSGINSVCVAATFMLLYNPWYFWDIGWRLSVSAVLSLVSFSKLVRSTRLRIAVSPVIWTTTYPLVSSVFGAVPLAGLFVNFIAVPSFAFILPVISLCALMALAGMPFSGVAVNVANYVLSGWEQLCNFIALLVPYGVEWSLPFAVIALNSACLMLLRAINVPWSRILIFILVGNLIVPFISATVVV